MRGRTGSRAFPVFLTAILRGIAAGLAMLALSAGTARAGTPYVRGDVFAAVGGGNVKEFTPTGTLVQTLNDTTGSTYTTGMCFDAAGNLYVTNIALTSVSKFDNSGNLVNANFLTGLTAPESCVLDNAGNIYVGEAHFNEIKKFSSTGTLLATYTTPGGSDWIDLAADQCTLYYDNEGNAVHRFNACTNTPLSDFASGLPGGHYALRILPNGQVIVAAGAQVQLLDTSGAIVSTYTAAGESSFFALNRDPDGVTFWSGGITSTGNIYRFNFAPVGPPITTFSSSPSTLLAGLSIFGELVVSQPTPTPTGGAGATPTPTATSTPVSPTATRTPTVAPVTVPTLSFPMLGLLGVVLAAAALLLISKR